MDTDDWEMIDGEASFKVSHWINPDNKKVSIGKMDLEEEEIYPSVDLEEMVPDGVEVEEATGNEGATMERWYKRAVVVIWPNKTDFDLKLAINPNQYLEAASKWADEIVQKGFTVG